MTTDHNHLDAETVAAWMDGGLDATSLAAAEAHASNCDRCQALLATVARTLPAGDPAGAKQGARGTFGIWKWWLAPLAATAAAVTLWMVVPQDPMRPESMQSKADTVQQPQASPSVDAPAAAPSAPPPSAPPSDARFSESRRNVPAARADRGADVEAKAKLAEQQANTADTTASRDRQEKREANLERPAAAEPVAAAGARVAAAPPAAPAARAAGDALGAAQLRKQTAPLELVSPDPRFRWRATGNTIEHSQDGGRNWIPVRLTVQEVITGGSSPSPLVCWFVGRRGLVLLATDGTNFTPLPFPERVDLASITAADAVQATVTTADGRTFRTADSGRNWR